MKTAPSHRPCIASRPTAQRSVGGSDSHVLLRDIAPADGGLLVATDGGRVFASDAQGRSGLRTQDETSNQPHAADDRRGDIPAQTLIRVSSGDSARPLQRLLRIAGRRLCWSYEMGTRHLAWQGRPAGNAQRQQPRAGRHVERLVRNAARERIDYSKSAARYVQHRVELEENDAYLEHIELHGLRANLPPQIASLEIQPYLHTAREAAINNSSRQQQQRSGGSTQAR